MDRAGTQSPMVEQQVSAFEISLGDSTLFGRCQCEIRRRFSFGELFHSCHAVCVHPAEIARFQPFGQCLVKPARLLGRGVRQLGYPVDQQVQASVRIGRFVGFSQHILPFYAGIAVVKSVEFSAPFPAGCRIVPLRRFPCIFQITPPDPAERIIDRQQARQHGLVVNSSAETAIIDRIRRAGHADPIAGPDDDGFASAIPGCGSSGFRAVGHQVVLVVFRLPPMAECARFADHDVESRAVLP